MGTTVRTLGIACLLGLAFLSQGCAIFVRGDLQDVTLQSAVADVRVEVDGEIVKLAPTGAAPVDSSGAVMCSTTVELDRNRVHVIRCEAPGYDPLEVTLVPCLNEDWLFAEQCTMWPILWLPMAIDLNTGALNDLPDVVDLVLTRQKEQTVASGQGSLNVSGALSAVKEVKITLKKPKPVGESVHSYRTARMDLNDGF